MAATNLIVFRDDREQVSGSELASRLIAAVDSIESGNPSSVENAIITAGEVECSLVDCASPVAESAELITDALASYVMSGESRSGEQLQACVRQAADALAPNVRVAHPEGFSYYGLHPADFSDIVSENVSAHSAAIIGIRSIGTTLSAVVAAALNKRGVQATRTTVRPVGHPYDRETKFTNEQVRWIREQDRRNSEFVILDEGPGLSGSSFLSVAEALVSAGILAERITMIGTNNCDLSRLVANDAARRWTKFNWRVVGSRIRQRFADCISLSGGAWRPLMLGAAEDQWPACWPEMQPLQYWSSDRTEIYKFEGFGYLGQSVRARARALQEQGFPPQVFDIGDGMSCYRFIEGTPLARAAITSEVLDCIAEYCAFRLSEFRSDTSTDSSLAEMARFNLAQQTGREMILHDDVLQSPRAVICDCRMQPHKWIRTPEGKIFKTDGATHGDDHFMPGPVDITWDLAGAIVEWDLDQGAAEYLLSQFRQRSGESVRFVGEFTIAYAIFRMSFCQMASQSTADLRERSRLERARHFYRARLHGLTEAL